MAERRLVIVESPAKAKTIAGYLGDGYVVESSIGHIRDLPNRAADIPAAVKKEPWARLGVNVDDEFQPLYVVDPDKKKKVDELKRELKNADRAPARDGRGPRGRGDRLAPARGPEARRFPSGGWCSTRSRSDAIQRALGETREIDADLVDAQETRRILDRLYGYEVSPVLWKKVDAAPLGRPRPVGRDAARRRARARADALRRRVVLGHRRHVRPRRVRGAARRGRRAGASRRAATSATTASLKSDILALDEDAARDARSRPRRASPFAVRSVEEKPYTRRPAAPFMTSTLQQEASRKLRFSSQTTMRVAQRLYENGYITYMRTDSTTLSESALTAARAQAAQLYGAEYVPAAPRRYERKVKNAQEAHEAIRPAGDAFRMPADVQRELSRDEHALYELVWKRTVASQMEDARGQTASLRLGATASDGRDAEFGASGTVITFRGFLAAYEEGRDDEAKNGDDERRLPQLAGRRAGRADGARARRPLDLAAGAVHGGVARQGARGPGHRPPVDVRVDHGHDPRPRLRLQEGHGARADVPRVLGHEAAREALRAASSTTTSPRGSRTTSTGSPRARRTASTGSAASTAAPERHERGRACTRSSPTISRRSTRAT